MFKNIIGTFVVVVFEKRKHKLIKIERKEQLKLIYF